MTADVVAESLTEIGTKILAEATPSIWTETASAAAAFESSV